MLTGAAIGRILPGRLSLQDKSRSARFLHIIHFHLIKSFGRFPVQVNLKPAFVYNVVFRAGIVFYSYSIGRAAASPAAGGHCIDSKSGAFLPFHLQQFLGFLSSGLCYIEHQKSSALFFTRIP